MPWCDGCSRFYNPNSVEVDGTCRSCGAPLPHAERVVATRTAEPGPGTEAAAPERAPWHFWVLVVAVVVYLGWRAIDAVIWVVQQL